MILRQKMVSNETLSFSFDFCTEDFSKFQFSFCSDFRKNGIFMLGVVFFILQFSAIELKVFNKIFFIFEIIDSL